MAHHSKQKACFGCVDSKRRCDRILPSCSRCSGKSIRCVYPQPLPLQTYNSSSSGAADPALNLQLGNAGTPSRVETQAQAHTVHERGLRETRDCAPADLLSSTDMLCAGSSLLSTGTGGIHATSRPFATSGDLSWFLQPSAWNMAFHYQPPVSLPRHPVFSNFIRGLQTWLSRFLRTGHNPFIHCHLYPPDGMPQCMKDAYSAISISETVTCGNEHIVNDISSTYISTLLISQPADTGPSLSLLSTTEHLARTQALLIHLLLALFSPSIPRRARAESLIETLLSWTSQLWASAAQDASTTLLYPGLLSLPHREGEYGPDMVSHLHQKFILFESVRRTWLLSNIATGVYFSHRGEWSSTCAGDICITARAELWDATSSARWEAVVRKSDPLFLYSLHGGSLIERGVGASEVDEFARHLFTVMWGLDKVEDWVVRTGDSVSIMY